MSKRGYCLVSQQIRESVTSGFLQIPGQDLSINPASGFFVNGDLEARVQPGSFEPTLADEVFIIDTEDYGLLRPRRDETVYRTLLKIPRRKRPRKSIHDGFEIKSGSTYLIKLNEKVSPSNNEQGISLVRSSPKSSTGRLFPKTRFLADYNPGFDEINRLSDREIDLWLLVQPLPFNLVLWPGITLNQLRFFSGDARLSDDELRGEFLRNPLLYEKKDGEEIPIDISKEGISDGLRLNLDAHGVSTHGVFGLRARKNPDPIDLAKTDFYTAEDYFEPVIFKEDGRKLFRRGESYLVASNEILSVPPHLSAELRRHSKEGIEGRTHDAGFVDQGFKGDMVLELTSEEETEVLAEHEMPLSSLEFFRTSETPDKLYGQVSRSNYQLQQGPRISKHFKPFDFETAARNHEKLSRIVLVEDAGLLRSFRSFPDGFEPISQSGGEKLLSVLRNGFFHSRYDCEDDELVLQPIPYTVVFDSGGGVFSYIRTVDKKDYGDTRLLGKHSIGLGGHVTREDGPDYIPRCLEREVTEEEVRFSGRLSEPKLVGTLFAKDKPVDRVHFGLIYTIHTDGEVTPNEKSIAYSEFVPLKEVRVNFKGAETETWSRVLIPHIRSIYELSRAR